MKRLIIGGILLVFAFGWYSDYRKKREWEAQQRAQDEMLGQLIGGAAGSIFQDRSSGRGGIERELQGGGANPWPTFGPKKQRQYHYDNDGRSTGYSEY